MTVDDLIVLSDAAATAEYEAFLSLDAAGTTTLAIGTNMKRAGVTAIVQALRDEIAPPSPQQTDDWEIKWPTEALMALFNNILGSDAGAEKVAGGPSSNEDKVTAPRRAALATDAAPAVCVWEKSPLRLYEHLPTILYRTGCGADFFYNYKQCQGCGKPIRFSEAK